MVAISKRVYFKIKELLYLNGSSFLKDIHLLDNYYGKSIPEYHISLCLQLVFQSDFETLQNDKVEIIIANLKKVLKINFGVTIRI